MRRKLQMRIYTLALIYIFIVNFGFSKSISDTAIIKKHLQIITKTDTMETLDIEKMSKVIDGVFGAIARF